MWERVEVAGVTRGVITWVKGRSESGGLASRYFCYWHGKSVIDYD